jgi:hypothetical protein
MDLSRHAISGRHAYLLAAARSITYLALCGIADLWASQGSTRGSASASEQMPAPR